jgi:ABC-type branched-subunit amino acid transport system substrate-binding protein
MPDDPSNLHGRDRAVALVREFMTRPAPEGFAATRRTPILIFAGPKGYGKTALLGALEKELRDKVPYAQVDAGTMRSATWVALSRLVFDLNRTAAGYRKIPFPRFITAQIAISAKITNLDQNAGKRVRAVLERSRKVDKLYEFLEDLAKQVMPEPVKPLGALVRPIAKGLVSRRLGRRVVLGKGPDWWGAGDRAYDNLARLSWLTRERPPTDRKKETEAEKKERDEEEKEATKLLWSAFLADLRAAFARGHAKREWTLNCVLLLDNVDTEHGRRFYRELLDARRDDADPMTVVATSAGDLARHVAQRQRHDIPVVGEASYADYVDHWRNADGRDTYPAALRELTLDDVQGMLKAAVGSQFNMPYQVVVDTIYRFTRGHPSATTIVVKAIGQGGDASSLTALLAFRWHRSADTNPESETVEQRLLRKLLGNEHDQVLDDLAAFAAARDIQQAGELASSGLLMVFRDGNIPDYLQVHDSNSGRMVMLPVLRNLLLRRLASMPGRWTAVHTWLRDHGQESDHLYHALALRDITAVVRRLEEVLSDPRAWFDELHAVTTAPNDLDTNESDPAQVLASASYTGPEEEPGITIARVVAALWAANDPLSSTDRAVLYRRAAEDLRTLSLRKGVARTDFQDVAQQYEDQAEGTEVGPSLPRPPRGPSPTEEQDGFTPPKTQRARRKKGVQVTAIVMVCILALATGIFIWKPWLNRCGEGVFEYGGECIGVTDGSYVFDDQLAEVQQQMLAENERVQGQPHVTVALLTSLLPSEVGSVTWERVRAQLEGAHVAQLAANEEGREPKIRLVLANPGSRQQEWRRVVDQLIETADEERLVGVIGVGLSTTNAQETARALAAADFPMVASVATATDFNVEPPAQGEPPEYTEGFTRVSLTTENQTTALSEYLDEQGVTQAMLVYDINDNDLYTATLYDEFLQATENSGLSVIVESRFDNEASLDTQFREIIRDLCGEGAPDTVLYAGRAVLLDELINNLRERGCAREENITLVTGSDGSILRTSRNLVPQNDQPPLTIIYTPHVDPDAARQLGITEFDQLTEAFQRLGFNTIDLADGWGVMMHDAMLALSEAINRSGNGLKPGELPTRQDVRAQLVRSNRERNQVRGAGGTFTLDSTTGNAVGRQVPIIEVGPTGEFQVKAILPAR